MVQGTIVEGTSHRGHTVVMAARLAVGFVYKVSGFGLQMPRKKVIERRRSTACCP
ncbi:hypothetical protein LINGRAHAP2_LOCUS14142 [Linum grandiflorum]